MSSELKYQLLPGQMVIANESLLSKCSELYSHHYGVWSEQGVRPNQPIHLSKKKLCEWLDNKYVTLYFATQSDSLLGYAIAFSKEERNYGVVTWVTQLVVHKDYRNQGIAKNILFSIWGFSTHYAWGIVSANPYAIRALEKATRRRAVPLRIKKNVTKLKNIGIKYVPFIDQNTEFCIDQTTSTVNTNFFVSHKDTIDMLNNVITNEIPWNLGDIQEGWEWLAFTFNDQEQIELSKDEIEHMVETSDSVVYQAYSKMNLSSNKHNWMNHTVDEINYILTKTKPMLSGLIYDLGCGIGRHSLELAKRKYHVIGIDYIDENISIAKKQAEKLALTENVEFYTEDCRFIKNEKKASLVLCLYDVVGSFAKNSDNQKIIHNAWELLEYGGYAVFSVMNYESTIANADHSFSFEFEVNALLNLPASNTQQETGNVFDPYYYLVDEATHLVYRKEQFTTYTGLPVELIVRDRRFTLPEIINMFEQAGFTIIESKYVNASDWKANYEATDKKAKEILVICQKSETY